MKLPRNRPNATSMTASFRAIPIPVTADSLAAAGRIVRGGGLVAFPTETVYGLGANAREGRAVARIFEAKGRPRFNPLIAHVASLEDALAIGHFTAQAEALADAFWPGPLTLVVPRREDAGLSDLVTAGLPTVALRLPAHDIARALIGEAGVPIAAPSANISGRVSATRAKHVAADFGASVDMILDGGPCAAGLESSIVALTDGEPVLLRAGALPAGEIERVLGRPLHRAGQAASIQSPGMMQSHYAPRAALRLNAEMPLPGEAFLAFGPAPPPAAGMPCLNLSPSGDLREAASNLFAHLRALDASGAAIIAAMPIPDTGLGEAINDRLRRAAAPRLQ
jgi:L-threonylcarbamoyladenylate synthase